MAKSAYTFRTLLILTVFMLAGLLLPVVAEAASLVPTRPALLRQVQAARSHGFTYLQNEGDVARFVRQGHLVPLPGNADYVVKHTVTLPYARPEVRLFIERLADQYRGACGERLVVTSLVRPKTLQPPNSSPLSVHPTGMAMDLRISRSRRCRAWLETALIGLERSNVLEAARERRPPHYHVVLFPRQYASYVEAKTGRRPMAPAVQSYRVRQGDSLWVIARRHGTTVRAIQRANGLASTRIKPSQVLKVPVAAR